MVELLPSKQAVASSSLVSRSVGPIAQWQSNRLITGRFLVRVQVGPLNSFQMQSRLRLRQTAFVVYISLLGEVSDRAQ